MKYLHTLFFAFLFLALSCGDNVTEEPDESNFGYRYFPIEVGYTWEYQVDSVLIFQGGNANVFSTSFVQEKVTDLLSENGDERVFRIERSIKSDQNDEYKLQDVWQTSIDNERAIKTEENLKFIKLVFPALPDTKWDGNVFFDSDQPFIVAANEIAIYQDWKYKIEEIGLERTINDISYSDVLHLVHIDEESLVNKRYSDESYAANVGLIERNMMIFDTQKADTSLDWLVRAEEGFQLKQTLISFSTN